MIHEDSAALFLQLLFVQLNSARQSGMLFLVVMPLEIDRHRYPMVSDLVSILVLMCLKMYAELY